MADEYKLTIQVEGAEVTPQTPTERQQAMTREIQQQPPQQQVQRQTTERRKQTSELGTVGLAGAGIVAAGAFNYALQQPSRSGNSNAQQNVNNKIALVSKIGIAASSPAAAVIVLTSMVVEAVTWKLNDDRRREKEGRQQNNAIMRAGKNRNGRSR